MYTVFMKHPSFSTKDAVLACLADQHDYVSGEILSKRIGVSRAAVNGAVKALRGEGFVIDSVTNRGYLLRDMPDLLSVGLIAKGLRRSCGRGTSFEAAFSRMHTVHVFDEADSTNRILSQLALENAPDGTVVIADAQTKGRGRLGRSFSSPKGLGLYFSYLIRPEAGAADLFSWTSLTSRTAVCVCDAIETVSGVRPHIKWVNDLYMDGKKICGILTQTDMEPESGHIASIVIGIGINVHETSADFPKELRELAGSVFSATGMHILRAHLAAEMIAALDRLRDTFPGEDAACFAKYVEDSLLPGTDIDVISGGKSRAARALSIEQDYGLRVRYENGSEEVLHGGEVSIRAHKV